MDSFRDELESRRTRNKAALAAFGAVPSLDVPMPARLTDADVENAVFTIGYEGRDGRALVSELHAVGVRVLIDVREIPFSRKPDFRKNRLSELCSASGIVYESWPRLGSTKAQRERLKETGDLSGFMRRFRKLVDQSRRDDLLELIDRVEGEPVALLCYERCHEECHRSVLADFISDETDKVVVPLP